MSIAQGLLAEFDMEMANTRRTLERIPEDKLEWKPDPKSMSMGRLAAHVAEMPGCFGIAVGNEERAADRGLEDSAVALIADRAIEDDPRTAQPRENAQPRCRNGVWHAATSLQPALTDPQGIQVRNQLRLTAVTYRVGETQADHQRQEFTLNSESSSGPRVSPPG